MEATVLGALGIGSAALILATRNTARSFSRVGPLMEGKYWIDARDRLGSAGLRTWNAHITVEQAQALEAGSGWYSTYLAALDAAQHADMMAQPAGDREVALFAAAIGR